MSIVPHREMHVASMKRCNAVADSTPIGSPSMQRRAALAPKAPKRGCLAGCEPSIPVPVNDTGVEQYGFPYFPAVIKESFANVQVGLKSGSPINMIKSSTATDFNLGVVTGDFRYEDYF